MRVLSGMSSDASTGVAGVLHAFLAQQVSEPPILALALLALAGLAATRRRRA